MDPLSLKIIFEVAHLALGLFNSPRPVAQCVEAPAPVVAVVKVEEVDACVNVSAEEWARVGQRLYDAYEGTSSKSEICKAIVKGRTFARRE